MKKKYILDFSEFQLLCIIFGIALEFEKNSRVEWFKKALKN